MYAKYIRNFSSWEQAKQSVPMGGKHGGEGESLLWTKATAESDRLDWVWSTQGCGYQEVLVLLHGVWNHSTALFESKIKKTKNNKKKKKQHSLQPWPPSCEYLLTRSIFIRQKASSNNSLEMDKH